MTEPDTELPTIRTDRVRFAETDAQGIVFYGNYFIYLDEGFNAYLREIDYRYARMHEEGWTTHVVHADLDYHAAARFEERVESRLDIVRVGETSLTAAFEARNEGTGERLASGSVVHVAVDRDTSEAIRVPDDFREAVAGYRAEPLE